jgi:hypothetical protein
MPLLPFSSCKQTSLLIGSPSQGAIRTPLAEPSLLKWAWSHLFSQSST